MNWTNMFPQVMAINICLGTVCTFLCHPLMCQSGMPLQCLLEGIAFVTLVTRKLQPFMKWAYMCLQAFFSYEYSRALWTFLPNFLVNVINVPPKGTYMKVQLVTKRTFTFRGFVLDVNKFHMFVQRYLWYERFVAFWTLMLGFILTFFFHMT